MFNYAAKLCPQHELYVTGRLMNCNHNITVMLIGI